MTRMQRRNELKASQKLNHNIAFLLILLSCNVIVFVYQYTDLVKTVVKAML